MPMRNLPIRRKLMTVILVTSGAVLLLTCSAFFLYEYITFRQASVRQLLTLGQIVATNSTAALAFDDHAAANEILAALRAERQIVAAGLYDEDGRLFAQYPTDLPREELPATAGPPGFRFANGRLAGFQPVVQGDGRLGTIYLRSSMAGLVARLQLYALIALLVVAVALILAYMLSRTLQRQISKPVLDLVDVATAVSDRGDYTVRAHKHGQDEVGALTDAFNHMLTRIAEQVTRLNLLNHLTHAIGERQTLDSIFEVVLKSLEEDLPIDFGVVLTYAPEDEELRVSYVSDRSREKARSMGMAVGSHLPVETEGLGRTVRGSVIYESEVANSPASFAQRLAGAGLHSLVMAPLAVESKVFGLLVATRLAPDAFSSRDCEFIRQLSEHVAIAAHQAQLYEALQQAYDTLRLSQQTAMQQERLRALGQMASGIAHDINNAISPVALYTETLLESKTDLSDRAREYLTTIQHSIDDVAATVSRMREFYREREEQLTLTPVDLNALVRQVVELTRARWSDIPQEQGIDIDLKMELDPDLPSVMGVEGEIREALTNLIFNAVDAMPQGGQLNVRTRGMPGDLSMEGVFGTVHARVEIRDTGIGMDEETRRQCLEPFYTTKGDRGTGLGLAMVYGMTRRHSGEIQIESAPGVGTTVSLLFPASFARISGAEHDLPEVGRIERLQILVVDDDPLLLKSLRDTLEGEGHSVVTASSGQAGIDAMAVAMQRDKPFSVVITDLGMPHMDGREVARAVKEASPGTPVIMLTGWGKRLLADGEIPPHVDFLLSKPPRLRELRETLTACWRAKES
ncbi:MAG TPA: ATP-binding protein [Rhodothermales bacterium]